MSSENLSGGLAGALVACLVVGGLTGCGGSVILIDAGSDGAAPAVAMPGGDDGSTAAPGTSSGTPGSSGNTGSGPGSSSGPSIVVDVCPPDTPPAGSSCSEPGHGCAYSNGDGVCFAAFLCDQSGHWVAVSCR